MQTAVFKDARYFQVIFQGIFLCFGVCCFRFNTGWWLYATYFVTSMITQFACEIIFAKSRIIPFSLAWWKKYRTGIPSVLITSLGLSLLLKTNIAAVAMLASVISILSKYILKYKGKSIFNPSALGIAFTVWITGDAWISPGQWGSGIVLLFGVCSLGFVITTKVQKADISIAFLGTFVALFFARQVIYQGWPMDYFVQSVSTGSLLLFSFFMITDPKTTPNHATARIIWAILVAVAAFYLTAFKFVNGAPILVLVCAQPFVPLFDKIFKAKKFEWKETMADGRWQMAKNDGRWSMADGRHVKRKML
jgi:Na+-transporting NADH:ubiquinone oxidoreductase subunit NqrB